MKNPGAKRLLDTHPLLVVVDDYLSNLYNVVTVITTIL